mgnify:CR=1 FL=1
MTQAATLDAYGQLIEPTTLRIERLLPGPIENGPFPTVVEYSGYQPSDPDSAQLAAVYTAQGFAYVGVNMRGTGCSGGSYNFFEEAQLLDGYDVIEAVDGEDALWNGAPVGQDGDIVTSYGAAVELTDATYHVNDS